MLEFEREGVAVNLFDKHMNTVHVYCVVARTAEIAVCNADLTLAHTNLHKIGNRANKLSRLGLRRKINVVNRYVFGLLADESERAVVSLRRIFQCEIFTGIYENTDIFTP